MLSFSISYPDLIKNFITMRFVIQTGDRGGERRPKERVKIG
jgi:hypothetical protein